MIIFQMIIGILGKKGSGKDECGNYFHNMLGFEKYHYADPLKKLLKDLLDMSDEQLYGNSKETVDERYGMTPRFIMQYIGTDLLKNKFMDSIWIKKFENIYEKNNNTNYCICDVRFQNEIDSIHKFGGYVIKITRNNIDQNDKHISENEINTINNFDYEINNCGSINDLYDKLKYIYNDILLQDKNIK